MKDIKTLKDLLTELGMSPTVFAANIGVTEQSVQGWIKGKSKPSAVNLLLIKRFIKNKTKVECDPVDLFDL